MRASVRVLVPAIAILTATALPASGADRVKTANGIVESTVPPREGVRSFKGLPFAAPPVGDLRWREPQPVENWTGVRSADKFGPACMQRLCPNADYWLRGDGMGEDCLYLNVWTPAKSGREKLPVLVYIFGGGFQNGDGSEPRYDGESMARKGIVAVSVNYRTNIFGFFVHPELTRESPHHASGNYGLLDQVAALLWVQKNIAAFGGDPKRVDDRGRIGGVDFGQRAHGVSALQEPDGRSHLRERRGDCEPASPAARRSGGGRREVRRSRGSRFARRASPHDPAAAL